MDDKQIILLYEQRDESAIKETKTKYGAYCLSIATRILENPEDSQECENDTYLKVWNNIPPDNPVYFSAYLGAITRNLSLDRLRKKKATKRTNYVCVSLEELEDCIPTGKSIAEEIEAKDLAEHISAFLRNLPESECNVFLNRYWGFLSIEEIADKYSFSKSKVKMMLLRTRTKLSSYLIKEGFIL